MAQSTQSARLIRASAPDIYRALTDPRALETWQVPGNMKGIVHEFDLRPGGGYKMSLFYPENLNKGKTESNEDRFSVRFIELIPNQKIVEAVNFESPHPEFSGEMIMEINLDPVENGTRVSFYFKNIPVGIKPEDNEAGTISSLEKLALYTE